MGYTVTASPNPVTEGNGATITFRITRTSPNLGVETVYVSTVNGASNGYAVNSSDYATNVNNLALSFTANQTFKEVTLSITNDSTPESDETFGVIVQRSMLDSLSTFLAKTNWTIRDDDVANRTPTASGNNQSVAAGTPIPLSTLFNYSDPDGASDIGGFAVQDRTGGGGHLFRSGVQQADITVFGNSTFGIPISELGLWTFVAGPAGSTDTIGFNAIDRAGAASASATATVTVASNRTPTASGNNQSVAAGTPIPLSTLFNYSDPDGASDIGGFAVQDRTGGGGHLFRSGVQQADITVFGNSTFGIPISELGLWTFVAGPAGSTDTIGFNAIDRAGAASASATATVTVASNRTPTASGNNQSVAAGTPIPLSTLFNYSDPDGASDIGGFAVQDRTGGGGHLFRLGLQQADITVFGNSTFGIPISELGLWTFVAGPAGSTDTIGFNAIDRAGAASASATATVNVSGGSAPSASGATVNKSPGQGTPLASLFTYSDPDNDIVAFAVRDRDVGGGHLTKDNLRQTENQVFDSIPIADIGRWAFVAGTSGSSSNVGFNTIDSRGSYSPSATAIVNVLGSTGYSLSPASVSVGESQSIVTFTITRSTATLDPLTLYFSTAQTEGFKNVGDYAGIVSKAVPFIAGQRTATVDVTITNDGLQESTEAFAALLQQRSGDGLGTYLAKATYSIVDNDTGVAGPSVSIGQDVTVSEKDGTMSIPLTLSAPATQTLTVTYATYKGTASSGDKDYAGILTQTVTFLPGDQVRQAKVTLIDDKIPEGTESFTVRLEQPQGLTIGRSEARVTILDDDAGSTSVTGNASMAFLANMSIRAYVPTERTAATTGLVLLTVNDLPSLKDFASGDAGFPRIGLTEPGLFQNFNAAALVGKLGSTLVVAYRGTDHATQNRDPVSGMSEFNAFDLAHWTNTRLHFELFNDPVSNLFAAIKEYAQNAANGISKVVFTGHSLGGAMAQMSVANSGGLRDVQAVTFGTLGDTLQFSDKPDSRIVNLMVSTDIAKVAGNLGSVTGTNFTIVDGTTLPLIFPVTYHSQYLYADIAEHLTDAGLDFSSASVRSAIGDARTFFLDIELNGNDWNISPPSSAKANLEDALGTLAYTFLGSVADEVVTGWQVYSIATQGLSTFVDLLQTTLVPRPGGGVLESGAERLIVAEPDAVVGIATGEGVGMDMLVDVRSVLTGSGDDTVYGSNIANALYAGAGSDILDGRGGDDFLFGEAGADSLTGGPGNDRIDGGDGPDIAVFASARGSNMLVFFDGDVAVLNGAARETDRLTNVETLQFSDQNAAASAAAAFRPLDYIASFGDLIGVFGANAKLGFDHFIDSGFFEGRGPDQFDGFQYLASYTDLLRAIGPNGTLAAQHFITNGFLEGRSRDLFDGFQYLASYTDLLRALGPNESLAAQHFVATGFNEGRSRDLFDGFQYLASYTDLLRALGPNESLAAQHFVATGFNEGRVRDAFDGIRYIASHDDLIRAIGANEALAGQHFVANGFNEGRSPTSFDPLQYIASHGDLVRAFGANATLGSQHFVASGFSEGRARDTFDAAQYLANYADLRAVFGNDQFTATLHYIQNGFAEGRTDDPFG